MLHDATPVPYLTPTKSRAGGQRKATPSRMRRIVATAVSLAALAAFCASTVAIGLKLTLYYGTALVFGGVALASAVAAGVLFLGVAWGVLSGALRFFWPQRGPKTHAA